MKRRRSRPIIGHRHRHRPRRGARAVGDAGSGEDTFSQVIHPPEFYAGYGEIGLTHWSEFSTKDSPIATEEPTLEPATAAPAQPTALPAYMSLDPGQDRDCDEFPSQADAQAYWQAYRTADRPNPGRLDGNGNSNVCEDPDRAARQAPAPVEAAPPPAAPSAGCVNFNSAGYDELRRIKYVEDKIANEILAKRPFSGWSDLVKQVNGIGENSVKEIQAEGIGCF